MRKVILSMMVSVDGYIQANDPNFNWHNWNEEMSSYMLYFFKDIDTLIYGRKSSENITSYWPRLNGEFAQIIDFMPALDFSKTINGSIPNLDLFKNSILYKIKKEKEREGKNMMLFVDIDEIDFFIHNNIIDEYHLILNPIILGGGKQLFKDKGVLKTLKLKDILTFNCENIIVVYEPKQ